MPPAHDEDPPNIVVIYVDDTDSEWLGCYGGPPLTPNIDRIAAEGLRFDRYYTTSPVCAPSRYGALTGQYPSRSVGLQRQCPTDAPPCVGFEPGILVED
jgi:arylsulfatase A-like enzyme